MWSPSHGNKQQQTDISSKAFCFPLATFHVSHILIFFRLTELCHLLKDFSLSTYWLNLNFSICTFAPVSRVQLMNAPGQTRVWSIAFHIGLCVCSPGNNQHHCLLIPSVQKTPEETCALLESALHSALSKITKHLDLKSIYSPDYNWYSPEKQWSSSWCRAKQKHQTAAGSVIVCLSAWAQSIYTFSAVMKHNICMQTN